MKCPDNLCWQIGDPRHKTAPSSKYRGKFVTWCTVCGRLVGYSHYEEKKDGGK
jgi:hypothetical protein